MFFIAKCCVVDEVSVLYVEVTESIKKYGCCYSQPYFRSEQGKIFTARPQFNFFSSLEEHMC